MPLNMHKMCRFKSSCACAKHHPGLCSPCIQSVVSNDSVSRQGTPRSDWADTQVDVGLSCLHMLEEMFSHASVLASKGMCVIKV